MTDNVSAPEHYTRLTPEPLAVLGSWNLPYCRSQALKYIARAGHKNNEREDIQKAIFYLRAELARLNGDTEAFDALAGFLDGGRDEPEPKRWVAMLGFKPTCLEHLRRALKDGRIRCNFGEVTDLSGQLMWADAVGLAGVQEYDLEETEDWEFQPWSSQ